jgi:hypothetical protein
MVDKKKKVAKTLRRIKKVGTVKLVEEVDIEKRIGMWIELFFARTER